MYVTYVQEVNLTQPTVEYMPAMSGKNK
jgi:hypothetical protein